MVRRRLRPLRLLPAGALLLCGIVDGPGALGREQDPPEPQAEAEPARGRPPAGAAKVDPRPEREAPAVEAGEGDGERAPLPPRPEEGRGEPGVPADDDLALRVREIEEAIWRQVASVELRLAALKSRLMALRGPDIGLHIEERAGAPESLPDGRRRPFPAPVDAAPGPLAPDLDVLLPEGGVLFSTTAEERLYSQLLRRQDDIIRRWRRTAPDPEGRGARRAASAPAAAKEQRALRDELRAVLAEVLDLRERARERQIESLRRELDDIARAIEARRGEGERRRLIEGRLDALLGEQPAWVPGPGRP
jgi:hypothetical protein